MIVLVMGSEGFGIFEIDMELRGAKAEISRQSDTGLSISQYPDHH